MEKIERLEAQVKYLSEMHGASSTPIPVAYHSPLTIHYGDSDSNSSGSIHHALDTLVSRYHKPLRARRAIP